MRNTFLTKGKSSYRGARAADDADGASIPAPVGGWDAISPVAQMPAKNATALVNWFPQPGYVEFRRGHLIHCNTTTASAIESLMGYMAADTTTDILIAASAGKWIDVTGSVPAVLGTGYANNRWQFTKFAGSGGNFLWAVNGQDPPQYWDGAAIVVPVIVRSDGGSPNDFISVTMYNSRLWCVAKNTTKAFYMPLDSVAGTATMFDVGNQFINGGYLQAIGTWATTTTDGPQEFIAFISSEGDVAIYIILDPTTSGGIVYRGRSEISMPLGWRCVTKIGGDLGVITIDGVLPLSQILAYDKAALIGASITKNIRTAITKIARSSKDLFGWQLHSYPRNTMAILNVPIIENTEQQQYVMNTVTGAWGQFEGQNGSCWEVFHDKPYFGGNDGVVREADAGGGDENLTLTGDLRQAFNYFGARGQLKQFTTIRPNITVDANYPVQPTLGINVDFGTNAMLDPVQFTNDNAALWNSAIWDSSSWSGNVVDTNWATVSGLGYCASIRMAVTIPWSESVRAPRDLQISGFDMLYRKGAFI